MAVCEREYWRVQQDRYPACPSSYRGVISSTCTKILYSGAEGLYFQIVDSLGVGAWLPHFYFAQPPCRLHHSHCLVMDWIPRSRACTPFARIFDYHRPVHRFGHSGAVAFGFGRYPLPSCMVCLRGSQCTRHLSPPRLGRVFRRT